ncbi:hypothetical protein BKA67DRAFT_535968 [Truncatella angustata]|uniref:Uncharacterized protein n=1 Tax=Truncatella angustata TaxID=152316 RepID=A0A9P8ULW3_9PEZI|nr:uncharacterized protein BKA67DRAFT_535968 [Truncatella angustata]KAH6654657.1 hypothetical protein BKA67DRAFT_535968 [Truncatella angustata]KAH8199665.1 hypothetical protein TruAng_006195 [Truncatella angustata]
MDVISTNPTGPTPRQLRRVGKALRPAIAKGLKHNLDQHPYVQWPQIWQTCRFAQQKLNARVNHNNRQRKATQHSRQWVIDGEDGAALARSHVWLPSDGCRQKPKLERQEAFRVPETVYMSDIVESDADLYRMGLLYDDDHARGSGFNLNTIVHSNIVYEVRPARRPHKSLYAGHNQGEPDERGSVALDQFVAAAFQARSTAENAAEAYYPSPASTPPPVEDEFPEVQPREDSHLEKDDDCQRGWDLLDSDLDTVSNYTEDGAEVPIEAWIVLGET